MFVLLQVNEKGRQVHIGKTLCHISQLVCALWVVNLADHILLDGPLKLKAVFVAIAVIYCQVFLTFLASKSLKLSFTRPEIVY